MRRATAFDRKPPRIPPAMSEIKNSTSATKNTILAMPTAAPAIPPKPSTAAITAMIKQRYNKAQHVSIAPLSVVEATTLDGCPGSIEKGASGSRGRPAAAKSDLIGAAFARE